MQTSGPLHGFQKGLTNDSALNANYGDGDTPIDIDDMIAVMSDVNFTPDARNGRMRWHQVQHLR